MDIKVITRHAPSNYGSLLQSIATLRVFKKLGHDCTVIDYRRKDEQGINSVLSPLKGKAEWNGNFAKKYFMCCFVIQRIRWLRSSSVK